MGYLSTGAITDVATAAFKISDDPHLPEVACQVLRLSDIEEGRKLGAPCPKISRNASPGRGIGLRHAVVPIRIAVKARENPIMALGFIAAVTLAVFGVGYVTGKKKRAA
jgi:hypothetical protein